MFENILKGEKPSAVFKRALKENAGLDKRDIARKFGIEFPALDSSVWQWIWHWRQPGAQQGILDSTLDEMLLYSLWKSKYFTQEGVELKRAVHLESGGFLLVGRSQYQCLNGDELLEFQLSLDGVEFGKIGSQSWEHFHFDLNSLLDNTQGLEPGYRVKFCDMIDGGRAIYFGALRFDSASELQFYLSDAHLVHVLYVDFRGDWVGRALITEERLRAWKCVCPGVS